MVIAYVGAGGKTTLLKRHARMHREAGERVLAVTSTHMFIEEDSLLTEEAAPVIRSLKETGYALAGSRFDAEKMGALPMEAYLHACRHADVVLVEADGSRHMPVKYPAEGEPVIYGNVDRIIVVCGLHALGRPLKEVCHRFELAQLHLSMDGEEIVTPEHILRLVLEGYVLPLRRRYPGKELTVCPTHDGSPEQRAIAEWICAACREAERAGK